MEYRTDPSIRETLALLRRNLWVAVLVGVVFAVGGYELTVRSPVRYSATSTLLVTHGNPDLGSVGLAAAVAPPIDAVAYETIAVSQPVRAKAATLMGSPDALADVKLTASVASLGVSSFVHVTAKTSSATLARKAANAAAQGLVEWAQDRSRGYVAAVSETLHQQMTSIEKQLAALGHGNTAAATQLRTVLDARSADWYAIQGLDPASLNPLSVFEPATTAREPSPMRNTLLGFVLGLLLTYLASFLVRASDPRVVSAQQLARLSGAPLMGTVRAGRRATRGGARAVGTIRSTITHAALDGTWYRVAILELVPEPVSGQLAVHLAADLAGDATSTLLVDLDMRHPGIQNLVSVPAATPPEASVARHLTLDDDGHDLPHASVTAGNGTSLHVLPSLGSRGNPQALIRTGLQGAAQRWSDTFEAIVMVAPPLLRFPEGWDVASQASVRILVAPLWAVTDQQVMEVANRFRELGMPLSGVVAVAGRKRTRRGREPADTPTGAGAARRVTTATVTPADTSARGR